MKKRKTYEISVIDKTYSKTISDETKFYTSDTALELVFKLKETEYIFESAEIVLFNVDDRSLVTRPVSKVNNDFTYELEDDIIAHYGEWRGQVRFEQDGEVYVSSPVKFRIENDLSNDRPPQLSDVQSWVSLKRYADGLVDELKQAVLSIEGIEDIFNANELERQTTFEMAESERDATFNANETTRQSQELEREKAEGTRQTTFTTNEANRNETFNATEATRQVNETTRQQAEIQRQSTFETNETERQNTFEAAEQARQSAELTRVENDVNRENEIINIKNDLQKNISVKLTNNISNGNFSNGLDNWNISGLLTNGSKVVDGKLHVYGKNSGSIAYPVVRQPSKTVVGHTYYFYIEISDMPENSLPLILQDRNTIIISNVRNGNHSKIVTVKSGQVLPDLYLNHAIETNSLVDYKVDHLIAIDLTYVFGVGNEPTKEVMDWIISENGYFDELTLKRDDIQQYEINQLRKAVIALGGTI